MGPAFVILTWMALAVIFTVFAVMFLALSPWHKLGWFSLIGFVGGGAGGCAFGVISSSLYIALTGLDVGEDVDILFAYVSVSIAFASLVGAYLVPRYGRTVLTKLFEFALRKLQQ